MIIVKPPDLLRQRVVFDGRAHSQQRGNHAAQAGFAVGDIEQLAILTLGDERGVEPTQADTGIVHGEFFLGALPQTPAGN